MPPTNRNSGPHVRNRPKMHENSRIAELMSVTSLSEVKIEEQLTLHVSLTILNSIGTRVMDPVFVTVIHLM